MIDVGTRKKNQPAPPSAVFEALTAPERPGGRPWLRLLADEIRPQVLESDEPALVVWASIWPKRPDAIVRFDPPGSGGGTDLRWTLSVEDVRVVDPGNGRYLGARETVRAWNPVFRVRPGTIIKDTAVRTTVVDDIDAAPPPLL